MDINRIFSKNNFSIRKHRELVDRERSILGVRMPSSPGIHPGTRGKKAYLPGLYQVLTGRRQLGGGLFIVAFAFVAVPLALLA